MTRGSLSPSHPILCLAYAAYEAPQHHEIARSVRSTAQRGREPAAEGIASLYEQTWVLVVVKIQTDDTESHVRTGSKPFQHHARAIKPSGKDTNRRYRARAIRICTMTHAVVHCEPGRPAPQRALSFTGNARGMALNMAEHQMVAFRDVDSCR